jgi:two-component system nitrogen regulation sensor histidine kinase NtrY
VLSLLSFRQPPGMTPLDARKPASGALGFLAVWKGAIAVTLAFISAIATFLILTGLTPFNPTPQTVLGLLVIDVVIAVGLTALVLRELLLLRRARRSGKAASELHVRVVRLFVSLTVIPIILVSVAAQITMDRSMDAIFAGGVERAISASRNLATAYVGDQLGQVRGEAEAMLQDIGNARQIAALDTPEFKRFMGAQAMVRGFAEAALVDSTGKAIQRADTKFPIFIPLPSEALLTQVAAGEGIIASFQVREGRTFLEAVMKTAPGAQEYLFVVRPINQEVSGYLAATREGLTEFQNLQERRSNIQIAFAIMFVLIGLLVILASVYLGLSFAQRMVTPIRDMIQAANAVAGGDLNASVTVDPTEGDLAHLGDTFNLMTRELRSQHSDLINARDQIDVRRRFSEAVLAGVTVGVIGIDDLGIVTLLNPSAAAALGVAEADLLGRTLSEAVPELKPVLHEAEIGWANLTQREVTVARDNDTHTLVVRVASERKSDDERPGERGLVVTLDDISDLVTAQRSAAWADIARRIAHEIKNPLTPIQLSAERLKRKYGKLITEDREVFDQCTDTIIRQVSDIGRMVDEFSSFARMPKAQFGDDDVTRTVREAVFLQKVGSPDITFETRLDDGAILGRFDRRLLSQALTNVIKNATEAIAAVPDDEKEPGHITVSLTKEGPLAIIDVIDNGIGLPKENRSRLLEPYVTTRAKGTGLGLAIVGKIMEEHGGGLELRDAPLREDMRQGACVRLTFRLDGATPETIDNAQAHAAPDRES